MLLDAALLDRDRQGLGASEALERALARCPPYVGESVIRHW